MTDPIGTPVLVVGFNRPDLMRGQLERLRAMAPRRLYVAVDGPRPGHPTDAERVAAVREAVSVVDWSCDVRTLFRDDNVGCAHGVSGAVSWMLEQEPHGIVLEDDILASPDFFGFAAAMLERYADDERVWSIGGLALDPPAWRHQQRDSYRFTAFPHYWGWAVWARSWRHFTLDMADWRARFDFAAIGSRQRFTRPTRLFLGNRFDMAERGTIDAWTPSWIVRSLAADAVHVKPLRALTANLAVQDVDATHPGYVHPYLVDPEPLAPPFVGPPTTSVDLDVDRALMRGYYEATWPGLARKVVRRARRLATRPAPGRTGQP